MENQIDTGDTVKIRNLKNSPEMCVVDIDMDDAYLLWFDVHQHPYNIKVNVNILFKIEKDVEV